jgi:hypothetical protein
MMAQVKPEKAVEISYWTKGKRLAFADFRGVPPPVTFHPDSTGTKRPVHKLGAIVKSIDVTIRTIPGKTIFKIHAGMKNNQSWIRNSGDSISLNHEQGHFDICEIYARILRREIRKAKSLTEARNLYEKVSADEEAEQDRFDNENSFEDGGITYAWKALIISRLKELQPYEDPVCIIPITR